MPRWTTSPPDAEDHQAYRILRTPPDKPLSGIITCEDVLGCPTHFVNNRTTPCDGLPGCKACEDGNSWRWHGYVSAILVPTFEHFMFEFTAAASDTFRNYHAATGTLRACKFTARRPSKRANGRVVIECTNVDERKLALPQAPDLKRILCHIWGIPTKGTTTNRVDRPPFKRVMTPPSRNGD